MSININTKLAKSISYGAKRNFNDIKYIVIHYTGNKGDTAKNNAIYFATSNTRQAGAHFFVDKNGEIYKSININRIAYAVGGKYSLTNGAGTYYNKCTNANSVSIELCDCVSDVSWEQMKAVRELVKYIQNKCPNANKIIRHWDVNGKNCPDPMIGANNKKWKHLYNYINNGYQYKVNVTKTLWIRSTNKVSTKNKIRKAKVGEILNVTKIVGNWGRLKAKTQDGKYRWVSLKKCKEI